MLFLLFSCFRLQLYHYNVLVTNEFYILLSLNQHFKIIQPDYLDKRFLWAFKVNLSLKTYRTLNTWIGLLLKILICWVFTAILIWFISSLLSLDFTSSMYFSASSLRPKIIADSLFITRIKVDFCLLLLWTSSIDLFVVLFRSYITWLLFVTIKNSEIVVLHLIIWTKIR